MTVSWGRAPQGLWMGAVIFWDAAARAPSMHNLLQIADVDSGAIRLINVDLVSHILPT